MSKNCIVCKSSKNKVVFKEFGIDILKCLNCKHVFSSYDISKNNDAYYGAESLKPEEHFWADKAHKKMYNNFYNRFIIDKTGILLDLGCGLGYFLKEMSKFSSWETFGYDISQQAVDYAKRQLGLKNIFHGRIQDSNFDKNSFDIITLWDVIEHLPNPDPLLAYSQSLLKKNGILFIHTPNIKNQLVKVKIKRLLKGMKANIHYLEAKDHANIYSMETLDIILRRNGFSKIEFIHLRPIQSVSGSKSKFLSLIKNMWFYFSVILFWISFKKINFDNLFIIAKK